MSNAFTNQKSVSLGNWVKVFLFSIVAGAGIYVLFRSFVLEVHSKELFGAFQSVVFILTSVRVLTGLNVDVREAFHYYNARVYSSLRSAFRYLLLLLGAGVLLVGAIMLIDILVSGLNLLPGEALGKFLIPESITQNNYLGINLIGSPRRLLLFLVTACVLAPLGEELIFRRLLYVSLRSKYSLGTALIVSSLLFGVLHGSQWFITFSKGLVIGYSYEKNRDILTAIFLHAFSNIIAVVISFIFLWVG